MKVWKYGSEEVREAFHLGSVLRLQAKYISYSRTPRFDHAALVPIL